MLQERKDRKESSGIKQLWEITKPNNPQNAAFYLELLLETLVIPKQQRYETPFLRPKKSGGVRLIVPAKEPLRTTQYFLSNWMRENLPQGDDYCYTGRKVNAALAVHCESSHALVCDLKDAFDQVTAEKIRHWFSFHNQDLRGKPLEILVDLLTYQDRAPQGCRSTAFAYNVVVSEMDSHLELIAKSLGLKKWTRYSDNICFSAKHEFDHQTLEAQVRRIAKGFGFEISWAKPFSGKIEYLGANIEDGKIFIPDEKVGEFADKIFDWLESADPAVYYHQALGILTWAKTLSGPNVHGFLLETLDTYFRKVGKPGTVEKNMRNAYGKML